MDKITASADSLLRQASMTATDYMNNAAEEIDHTFGQGFSKSHPELVAAFMRTAALDYGAAAITSAIQELAEAQARIADSE